MKNDPTSAPPSPPSLPPGIHNAYWFQGFNAISWQICLGSPLILFARELGASATTIGLLAGLAPILNTAQLPVSRYAEDIGYRKLMLYGWTARVWTLVFLTVLPLLGAFLPTATLVNILLVIMFAFTLLRGISTCSWFPWMTSIVPESLRGFYLSRDRTFINVASVVALMISGGILFSHHGRKAFAVVFCVGFLAGAVSLYFLKRIPDVPRAAHGGVKRREVGWRELIGDVPFRRLLLFGAAVQIGLSAHGTFSLIFLRDEIGLSNGMILLLNALSALMGMVALSSLGRHSDRVGSKPYLGLAWVWWVASFVLWFLLAIHAIEHRRHVATLIMALGGFFGSVYELSLTRLLMNTVSDREGRARFFALYAVVVSLIFGVFPVFWGMILDGLRSMHLTISGMDIDRYAIFFGVEFLSLFVIVFFLARLREPKARPTSFMVFEIFVGMPARGLSQLLQMFGLESKEPDERE